MAEKLLLIRHAESVLNTKLEIVNGRSNKIGLSALGFFQANRLGEYLAEQDIPLTNIMASIARRAVVTVRCALSAANQPNTKIITSRGLQEMSQGIWTGRLRADVLSPEKTKELDEAGLLAHPPQGESVYAVADRMARVIDSVAPLGDVPLIVFSHSVAIRSFVGMHAGWGRKELFAAPIANTSITTLTKTDGWWQLESFNQTPHLG